ncbi:helix-turn-helix transcriptional regulator [Streptomyces sp. LHD-70]|uniref:helix-turn-helix domain-containing protein n=1 Tax=Streptomyces sp. LHD-70 TaxID=3072140 RepID=UPI002810563A|nr:helix-turn-helix transcriptional regulator [Streptomyces sp. LHD-70]MDQ8703249.1 helix-turn-helix transcriptional regulator [Streptomyces sp. LHD-70]
MQEQRRVFGAELRRLRTAAGLTLTQFAASVHYSKGQISKVETGQKQATVAFARLCDRALDADGSLAALVPQPSGPRTRSDRDEETGVEMHGTPERGSTKASTPTRRQVMTAGAATGLAATGMTSSSAEALGGLGTSLLETSRALFDQHRLLGQMSPPSAVVPVLTEQARSLRRLAQHSGDRTGAALLNLSARYAELAGWMAQESGDDTAAVRLTEHAVQIAAAAGDRDLASYALVRRALISYYQGDAQDTVALSEGVANRRSPPRIRGLAAQHLAQGHALMGDHSASMRQLDASRALLEQDRPDPALPVLGPSGLQDPVTMITGWCLLDLGRPREAATLLDAACAALPPHALRNQARYGVRRALAHAIGGEIEHACAVVRPLLPLVRAVDSATVRLDLRRLSRTFTRFAKHPAVVELSPDLTAALHPAVAV